MSTPQPPTDIQSFFEFVRRTPLDDLYGHPDFIDWTTVRPPCTPSEIPIAGDHMMQHACFDYAERCPRDSQCLLKIPHAHSIAPQAPSSIEGLPGLYLHPEFFIGYHTWMTMVDSLLQDDVCKPNTITNLHETYDVDSFKKAGFKSFLDPLAHSVELKPHGKNAGTAPPLSMQQALDRLRWIKMHDVDDESEASALPARLKTLIDTITPMTIDSATAYITSAQETTKLRQNENTSKGAIYVSLGCDAIIVVGRRSATETGHVKALRLKTGDVLYCSDTSSDMWYGVAKAIKVTCGAFELSWPCCVYRESARSDQQKDWEGCMAGKNIYLVLQ